MSLKNRRRLSAFLIVGFGLLVAVDSVSTYFLYPEILMLVLQQRLRSAVVSRGGR